MILPMQDEETGAEPRVLSASICDPYLLLIRDDASAFVAYMNSYHELEEVEKEESPLASTKWVSGCLYSDTTALFGKGQGGDKNPGDIYMFLLSAAGALHVSFPRGPWTVPDSADTSRFTPSRTCPSRCMWPKDCATSHPF